jgi:hypothetical protein
MRISRLLVRVIVFSCLAIALSAKAVSAEELSLSIDPPIIQIDAEVPADIRTPISIRNGSDQNTTYSIYLVPFKANSSGNGQPDFDNSLIEEYKPIFSRTKILDQDKTLSEVTLAPRQSKNLELNINISQSQQPRDYYFSIIFVTQSSDNLDTNTGTGTKAGIGTNVLLSIKNEAKPDGAIAEFSGKKLISNGPVEFKLNLSNKSSYFVTPKGNLIIKNMFGQVVGNIEITSANILANSERLMASDNNFSSQPRLIWDERLPLGKYTAEVEVALSDQGPLLKDKMTFYAFPIQAVVMLVLILVLLIGMIKRARSRSRD